MFNFTIHKKKDHITGIARKTGSGVRESKKQKAKSKKQKAKATKRNKKEKRTLPKGQFQSTNLAPGLQLVRLERPRICRVELLESPFEELVVPRLSILLGGGGWW